MLGESELERDAELLLRCRKREVTAFQELFLRYGKMMQVIAGRMAIDEQMSKDIFQDAARLVIMKIDTFNARSALSTWLYRITVNAALTMMKKEKRYTTLPEPDTLEAIGNPASNLEYRDMVKHLHSELSRLPQRQKECASMFYFAEMSIAEIAKGLSMNEGAVKVALFKARKSITQALHRKGVISYETNMS